MELLEDWDVELETGCVEVRGLGRGVRDWDGMLELETGTWS